MNDAQDDSSVHTAEGGDAKPHVKWDDAKMQTIYANVVNAAVTREEVSIFFGTNQTWDFRETKEVVIDLSNRIVLNPYAAKRLLVLLSRIVAEYEKRFGVLQIDAGSKPGAEPASGAR